MRKPPVIVPYKLRNAFLRGIEEYHIVYLSASAGWGKTAMVQTLLEKRSVNYISMRGGRLPGGFPRERLIVLDDLQELPPQQGQRLLELLRKSPESQHFVLLSRVPLPDCLSFYEATDSLLQLGSDDLALDLDCLSQMADFYQAALSMPDLERLREAAGGCPAAARLLFIELAGGTPLDSRAVNRALERMGAYIEEASLRCLEPRAHRLLLDISFFDSVDVSLAEMLSGGKEAEQIMDELRQCTGLLRRSGNVWTLADERFLRPHLKRRAEEEYPPQRIQGIYLAGGRWYTLKNDFKNALCCYRQAGSRKDMIQLLDQSVRLNPGAAARHKLYGCCDMLAEEEIKSSPDMMCAMSLVCAAASDTEGTKKWYGALKKYFQGMDRGESDYPRVRGLLAYLELALPNRGCAELSSLLRADFELLAHRELVLPEFSPTGGLPSVLRGAKDLTGWVLNGQYWYEALREPVEAALGRFGVGVGDIALAESRLEQGEDVSGQLLSLAPLQKRLQAGGAPETEFALVALLARILCASGGLREAVKMLMEFRDRMDRNGTAHLLPNIDAMRCRLSLLDGSGYAGEWLTDQPQEEQTFFGMEHYRGLTKVRCWIQAEQYHSALLLLGRTLDSTQEFGRCLDRLETMILAAVCRFRMGGEDWREHFGAALTLGAQYGYVAVFAREGAALLPLMERFDHGAVPEDYWDRILHSAVAQASHYGNYLRPLEGLRQRLTQTEHTVLLLLCQDKGNEEICALVGSKLPTVKTHLRNLFRKLNVSSRTEAKAAAERLHLVSPMKTS